MYDILYTETINVYCSQSPTFGTPIINLPLGSKSYTINLGNNPTTGTYYIKVQAVNSQTTTNSINTLTISNLTPNIITDGLILYLQAAAANE
jgi:hypothetical protein